MASTNNNKSKLNVILGAMTIGRPGIEMTRIFTHEDAGKLLDLFQSHGYTDIDTARIYGEGSSEEYLGALDWKQRGLRIATKIYPTKNSALAFKLSEDQLYTHQPDDVRRALLKSKAALKTEKFDLYYLHGPDRTTPIEETIKEIDKLWHEGHFERWGVSNFMAWEVAKICELCKRNNWKLPSVYQGLYHALHRNVEPELIPCLRHYGMALYIFNPLAGGFLTDRYHREASVEEHENGSRFDATRVQGKMMRNRYWNDAYFDALDLLRPVAKKHDLTEAQCALRWLNHHSKLKPEYGDAVIIGAGKLSHLEQNLSGLEEGPLPDEVVAALDAAWLMCKAVSTNYFH